MCSLVRNFSSKSSLRSLAEETQEVSLICFIAEAFVHKSNSSAFFFLFHLHPTECPTNNFSSPHVKFQFIFAHFHHHITYSLYRWERLPIWLFFSAIRSDHWTARTREWRSPCVERNNLPSVFLFSEFSNPSDLTLLYSRWQPQSFDKHVRSY